jgi:beta-glucosidase
LEYVTKIVNEFKDIVDYWITISEPVASVVDVGYIAGIWPPGFVLDGGRAKTALHNLIEAHVKAYDKISIIDDVDADGDGISKRVGLAHAMVAVTSAQPTKFFGIKITDNTDSAQNFSYFMNDYFLNAVILGEEDLNYLNKLERRKEQSKDFIIHDEWKNKLDFVGINYYRRVYVNYSNILAMSSARFFGGMMMNNLTGHDKRQPHGLLNDLGWEIYPEGLYDTIMQVKTRWNKPVMITENGIAEKLDKYRAPYIVAHIEQVKRAMDNGADVLGYIYWSLMDNYEWQENYRPEARFGLYYVDRNGSVVDDDVDDEHGSSSIDKPLNGDNNNANKNKDNSSTSYLGRTLKEGAKALQFIIKESQGSAAITDSAISKAKSMFGTFTPNGTKLCHPSSS